MLRHDAKVLDEPAYCRLSSAQLLAVLAPTAPFLLVIADKLAIALAEHPLLVAYLSTRGLDRLRVVASELWTTGCDTSIADAKWAERFQQADIDGVFRGFARREGSVCGSS